jgi:hypothetical protein
MSRTFLIHCKIFCNILRKTATLPHILRKLYTIWESEINVAITKYRITKSSAPYWRFCINLANIRPPIGPARRNWFRPLLCIYFIFLFSTWMLRHVSNGRSSSAFPTPFPGSNTISIFNFLTPETLNPWQNLVKVTLSQEKRLNHEQPNQGPYNYMYTLS